MIVNAPVEGYRSGISLAVRGLPISFLFLSSQDLRFFKFPGKARVYKMRHTEPMGCLLCSSFLMCPSRYLF